MPNVTDIFTNISLVSNHTILSILKDHAMFIQPYVFAKNHKLFIKKINFIMYKLYLSKKWEENHPPKSRAILDHPP